MSSYINQIDAAIGAVQPISGANIVITPSALGGLVVSLANSVSVTGTVAASQVTVTGNLLLASLTPATPTVSHPGATLTLSGNYWNGTASVADAWTLTGSYQNSGGLTPPGTNDSSVLTLNYAGGLNASGFLIINAFQTNIHSETVMQSASAGNMFVGGNTYDGALGTFTSVANAVATLTTYTGPSNTEVPPAGTYVNIAGFTNSVNNGRFIVQGSTNNITTSTITVYNSLGAVESHTATWTSDLSNESGRFAVLGAGLGSYSISGSTSPFSSYSVGANLDVNPNSMNLVLSMQGNATDSAFFHVVNNGATGNHGLEMGAVIDGTGANPVFLNIGNFQGTPCVNIPTMPLVLGTTTTAATSGVGVPSPAVNFQGAYWTGSASASDSYTLQNFQYAGHSYALSASLGQSGGHADYTVVSTLEPLPPVNTFVVISGFTNSGNNGTFQILANAPGTLTVSNSGAVVESHPATAVPNSTADAFSALVVTHSGTGTGQVLVPNSFTNNPDIAWIGNPGMGFGNIGSSQLVLYTGTGSSQYIFSTSGFECGSGNIVLGANGFEAIISGVDDPISFYSLSAAANAVGPNTTYTGVFSPVIPVGTEISIGGFANTGNNISRTTVVSCNSTTLVVVNANGVAEVHAGLVETVASCIYIGTGGQNTGGFTATLGLPHIAYDPPATGAFTTTQAGRVWFNTSLDSIRYWDGASTQTLHGRSITMVTGTLYTTSPSDYSVLVNSASAFTVTLTTTGIAPDHIFRVKNINTGAVTVQGQTGNIDGMSTFALPTQNSSAEFQWDGSNWWVF